MNTSRPVQNLFDRVPKLGPRAFVAPSANVVGDVTLGADASVFYNSVIAGAFRWVYQRCAAKSRRVADHEASARKERARREVEEPPSRRGRWRGRRGGRGEGKSVVLIW